MKSMIRKVWFTLLSILLLTGCTPLERITGTPVNSPFAAETSLATGEAVTSPAVESPTPVSEAPLAPASPTAVNATPVPAGVYALYLFYSPLIVSYDPAQWIDHSQYAPTAPIADHYLQSTSLDSCRISEYGPSDFIDADTTSEQVTLGQMHYTVMFPNGGQGESVYAFYIDNKSVAGFDYSMALPVLLATSTADQWTECRKMAEEVLATLQTP